MKFNTNFKQIRTISVSLILILIMMASIASEVNARVETVSKESLPDGKEYPGWSLPRKIGIIYDSSNALLTATAINVYQSASIVYKNTLLISVDNWAELEYMIEQNEYWTKLYFINGSIEGITFANDYVGWEDLASVVNKHAQRYPSFYHVFGSGSTDQLRPLIPVEFTNIRVEGSAVVGAQQSFFYNVWEIGEILAELPGLGYQSAAEDFRILGVQYFAENANELINGAFNSKTAKDPLGEEDTVARTKAFEEELDSWNDIYQVTPDKSIRRLDDPTVPEPDTQLRLYRVSAEEENEDPPFKISDIPLFSGLEGPVAGVVDAILSVLIAIGGNALGLDPETAYSIVNTIKDIALMFSNQDEGDGDVKETIKSLLNTIVANAPVPESLKPFLPLIVDAFFLIRGEASDIIDFAGSTIETIFSLGGVLFANTSIGNNSILTTMMKVLKGTLLNGVELADEIVEAKEEAAEENKSFKLMNTIVNFALKKVINASTYGWWSDVLGGTNNTILENVGKLMGFFAPLLKAFTTGDMDDLMDSIPEIIEYLFTKMTNGTLTEKEEGACATIGQFYRSAMVFYDSFNLTGSLEHFYASVLEDKSTANEKTLFEFLKASLKLLEVTEDNAETRARTCAKGLTTVFADAAVNQLTSRETLKSNIATKFTNVSFPTTTPEAIAVIDALGWLGAIWTPTMNNPFASDIENLSRQFLVLAEPLNSTQSQSREDVVFVVIRSIFGLIALDKENTAAQLLLFDDAAHLLNEGLENGEKDLSAIRWKIAGIAKDSVIDLLNIFVMGKTNNTAITKSISVFGDVLFTIIQVVSSAKGDSITSFLRSIAMQACTLFFDQVLGINGTATMQVIQSLFTGLVGKNILGGDSFFNATQTMGQLQDIVEDGLTYLRDEKNATWVSDSIIYLARQGVYYIFMVKKLFTEGIDFIIREFKTLIAGFIAELVGGFVGKIMAKLAAKPLLEFGGSIGFGGGGAASSMLGVELTFNLSLNLALEWQNEIFKDWINDIIFAGLSFDFSDVPKMFLRIMDFLKLSPVFSASLTASAVGSGEGGIFSAVLAPLGLDLEVEGSVGFSLQLFSFGSGGFDPEGFCKILAWHFSLSIKVSKTITILELILYATGAGAAAAGTVSKVSKYIGLDLLTLTIWMSIAFEIYQKAAMNGEPAQGALTLTLGIGAYFTVGFDLGIIGLVFKLGLDIYLIFTQDLTPGKANLDPFRITLDVVLWASVTVTALFWDWTSRFDFRPPGFPLELLPPPGPETKKQAIGFDTDNDGLSDDQENESAALNPYSPDSDNDGLGDKFELKVSRTDPGSFDSDGDGLSDFIEWYGRYGGRKSDPLIYDTDMDGLSDGEEVLTYRTDPTSRDTDEDGLTDQFEVETAWNMTGITPSVLAVQVGPRIYNDHTDPLNPDTDNDLLLDGQEGTMGPWWGDPDNYPSGSDQPMLLFIEGYTHPLDNDTDDDSYYQYHDGSIAGTSESRVFLRDMRDGIEVRGIVAEIIVRDPDGFPEIVSKVFMTNPCNPDSDGDTGIDAREKKAGFFLNSDGYELSTDPATDPLDSDSDDDGLIDGLEGTIRPERNYTTNPLNPDTDGDSLPDGLEIALGTLPSKSDTDNDLILDGDEFFIYGTDPLSTDTDYDGVDDYWEIKFSHTNPHSSDTDGDGLSDFMEIYVYGTDPVDEDSDNDELTDRDEIFEYITDPMNFDSDGDGLRDGPEIFEYETDPNNIDSDFDSIMYPDENGDPTFLWTDYDEIMYGTDPKSIDSDNDNLLDSWELYLATGSIPNFENMPLDPLDNDSDDDGLRDGQELVISEREILIFPFIGYISLYPYITSPVDFDSDDDGLGDKYEIDRYLRPDLVDSDNDTLSDWEEIYTHLTDPRKNDTDGDGISDSEEVTMLAGSGSDIDAYNPRYQTNAFDPDSDFDGWPDGLELLATDGDSRYDPSDPDTNNNGILDGYERDFDNDLISDGDEYYTYNSYSYDGGFLDYRNPDSDFDGLMDGDEILVYGTQPYNPDTDYDGYSDPLELWIGTDPLVPTSEDEFLAMVLRLTSPLQMTSPEHNKTYKGDLLSIQMLNLTTLDTGNVYFRYRLISTDENATSNPWSDNNSLSYQGYSVWTHGSLNLADGYYEFQVFGLALGYAYPTSPDREVGSILLQNTIKFRIAEKGIDWEFFIPVIFVGAIFAASAVAIAIFILRKRRSLV